MSGRGADLVAYCEGDPFMMERGVRALFDALTDTELGSFDIQLTVEDFLAGAQPNPDPVTAGETLLAALTRLASTIGWQPPPHPQSANPQPKRSEVMSQQESWDCPLCPTHPPLKLTREAPGPLAIEWLRCLTCGRGFSIPTPDRPMDLIAN